MLGDGIVSFGTRRRDRVLEEAEVVGEDRLREPDPAGDVQRGGLELEVTLGVVEATVTARPARSAPRRAGR